MEARPFDQNLIQRSGDGSKALLSQPSIRTRPPGQERIAIKQEQSAMSQPSIRFHTLGQERHAIEPEQSSHRDTLVNGEYQHNGASTLANHPQYKQRVQLLYEHSREDHSC